METNFALKEAEVTLRLVCEDDLSAILELNHHLHETEPLMQIDKQIESVWSEIINDQRLKCFVAELDNKVIASCILDIVPNLTRGIRPFGVLQNVVTHADYRGKGIGKKLSMFALEFAWSKNCYQVLVQTGRPEVTNFYLSLGFRQDKIGLVAKPEWCKEVYCV